MTQILVTGGAGFIGSNFIRQWLKEHPEDHVTNFDALTYAGNEVSLNDIADSTNYSFIKADINDAKTVEEEVAKSDLVVHFAAESHVDRSILGPEAFVETNVKGTFNILEAVRKHGKHLHHISTDEVFGSLDLDSSEKFTEKTSYDPRSPYSASKAASDHLVRAYGETFDVKYTITNCSNNFGPYQHPEKFISRMITNLIDGQSVKIYGDGKYVRDWLYVTDHCAAIDVILQSEKQGETYVVGGQKDREYSNLDIAKIILEKFGKSEEEIEFVKDRPGHDRRYAVDWSKIQQDLGWAPAHELDEWLDETIAWYKNNEDWWRPLKEEAEKMYSKSGQ